MKALCFQTLEPLESEALSQVFGFNHRQPVHPYIEVLHLYTGRTMCKMLLPPPGLHADVNGDGVLDHVEAHGWNPHGSGPTGEMIPR